jgi:methylmalonyl-CoA mutase N-terminal domain/subunit
VWGSFTYCKEEIYPVRGALKLALDATEYIARNIPRMTSIVFNDTSFLASGANPIQAAAMALAQSMSYVEAARERGLHIDEFADSLSWFMGSSRDFFEQIARVRAFRRLWAKVSRERYGAENPRSWMARLVVRTSTKDLTTQQPMVNLIRGTYQALAAVLSGVQAITVTPFDEPICLPTDMSSLLSLRTQHVIAEESGVINTADPLGGSYFVESLTNEAEKKIMEFIQKIEAQAGKDKGDSPVLNGMIKGIESGFFDREFLASAREVKRITESGERVLVGFNKYVSDTEEKQELMRIEQDSLDRKISELKEYRKKRDQEQLKKALEKVTLAARNGENTIPSMVDAFLSKATLGEVMTALKEALGAYQKVAVVL